MKIFWFFFVCGIFSVAAAKDLDDWLENVANPEDLEVILNDLRRERLDLTTISADRLASLPFFDRTAAEKFIVWREARGGVFTINDVLNSEVLTVPQKILLREANIAEGVRTPRTRQSNIIASAGYAGRQGPLSQPAQWWGRQYGRFIRGKQRGYVYAKRTAGEEDVLRVVEAGLSLTIPQTQSKIFFGDFQCETGTGLVFAPSFGSAASFSAPHNTKIDEAHGLLLRPSADRRAMLRGAAISSASKFGEALLIASATRSDAQANSQGIERTTEGESTSPELIRARRDRLEERLFGGSLQAGGANFRGGLCAYRAAFSPALSPQDIDALPQLRGGNLEVGSLFASARFARIEWIGEIASSQPGGTAWQTCLNLNQTRTGLSIYHTYAEPDFFSPRSKSWSGFATTSANEQMAGIRWRVTWPGHALWMKAETYRTPFRTASSPLSQTGGTAEMSWMAHVSPKLEMDVFGARRWREEASAEAPSRSVVLDKARADLTFRLREEYRVRFEVRQAQDQQGSRQTGTLLFLQSKFNVRPMRIFTRITSFQLAKSELYTSLYENSLEGDFPLVWMGGQGMRAAILCRWSFGYFDAAMKAAFMKYSVAAEKHATFECGLALALRGNAE